MQVAETTPRFWTVEGGDGRCWTVRATGFGGHLILNARGQVVRTGGATGQRVLAAGAMIRTCGSREDAPSRMMIFDETGF